MELTVQMEHQVRMEHQEQMELQVQGLLQFHQLMLVIYFLRMVQVILQLPLRTYHTTLHCPHSIYLVLNMF